MRFTAFVAAVFAATVMAIPQGVEEASRGLVRRDQCVSNLAITFLY